MSCQKANEKLGSDNQERAVKAIGGPICPESRLCDTISKDTVSHILYFNLSSLSKNAI